MPDINDISAGELLHYLASHGKIDLDEMYAEVKDMHTDQVLSNHNHKIWEGENGFWYTYFTRKDGKRKLIKRKTKEAIEEAILNAYETKDNINMAQMMPEFKKYKRSCGISQKTIDLYDYNFDRFLKDDAISKKDMKLITDEDIESFFFRVFDNHVIKYKALSELYSLMKNLFKLAIKRKYITRNPCEFIDLKDYKKRCKTVYVDPEERVLGKDDCAKLLQRLREDFEMRPYYIPSYAVLFMLLTGMRVGEVAFLQWEHIKREKGYILVCGSEKFVPSTKEYFDDVTKTGKVRYVPLSATVLEFLDQLHAIEEFYGFLSDYVFSDETGRCHLVKLRSCAQHKCRQAGVSATGANALRRTFNSMLKTSGVSTTVASAILGHTEDVNNRHYSYDVSNLGYKTEMVETVNQMLLY